MKETLRHHRGVICVDDKEKLSITLPTFKQNVDEDNLCQYRLFTPAFEKEVMTLQDQNTSIIVPFNLNKADTSVFLHVWHVCNIILTSGTSHALIESIDTDVLIIALAVLLHLDLEKMWMGFGNRLNRINIPIHDIYQKLGHYRSAGLLFFYFLR